MTLQGGPGFKGTQWFKQVSYSSALRCVHSARLRMVCRRVGCTRSRTGCSWRRISILPNACAPSVSHYTWVGSCKACQKGVHESHDPCAMCRRRPRRACAAAQTCFPLGPGTARTSRTLRSSPPPPCKNETSDQCVHACSQGRPARMWMPCLLAARKRQAQAASYPVVGETKHCVGWMPGSPHGPPCYPLLRR